MDRHIGLDFGTTNSSLAVVDGTGAVQLARFDTGSGMTHAFRSVLYFEREAGKSLSIFAGPTAIQQYLDAESKGRFIQSIKSFATSHSFRSTNIFGRNFTFEELVAAIVTRLRSEAERQFGGLDHSLTVGRPVRFAGAGSSADDAFALARLRSALELSGFRDIVFEYEPIGAAYHYESRLDHDELVLIADFGGGTSDFSLIRVGPGQGSSETRILGTDGVGLAGDVFDASIIRHLVAPRLGRGSFYKSLDKMLPVPSWIYSKLERWHHLSFLKTSDTMAMLRSLRANATEPERLDALIDLIENDLGYQLHRSVQKTKVALSQDPETTFRFSEAEVEMFAQVERTDFNGWISAHLMSLSECVDRLIDTAGVSFSDVDKVFLTGGSSLVPAVREIFATRFGSDKLAGGEEFTSVASGLALRTWASRGSSVKG